MKHIKKAAAILMAVVLSLCLAVTAFAEGSDSTTTGVQKNGTLTVTGSGLWVPGEGENAGKGKTVTAIRMFTARVTAGDQNKDDGFDTYTLDGAWKDFFTKDATRFGAVKIAGGITDEQVTADTITDDELSDAVVAYIKTLANGESDKGTLATFAHNAQKWARVTENHSTLDNAKLIRTVTATSANDTEDVTKGTATFENLIAGYYLIFPEGGSTGTGNRATDAIFANVPKSGAKSEVTIKSTFPTVDKKVKADTDADYKNNTSAQVGDAVNFKLTAKVPDMTDYATYKFVFHDTLSNGLVYDANSVKVTVAGTEVTKDTAYTVTEPTAANNELTVTFANLKTVTGADAGAEIVVTYTAKITKDAVTEKPAENKVYLEYRNDPSNNGTGTSNPDESKVYTYQIDIDKFAITDNNAHKQLSGATFELKNKKSSTATAINLVKETSEDNSLVYHIKGTDETKDTTVTSVTTDETGKITIKGLKAGTYYLYETEAPTGYNKLTKPVEIVITADENDPTNFTYKIDGKASTAKDATVPVENIKGTMLPETGSIGTIGLTALGVVVVLLGVFAPRKKKENH